jgi:hypothetical protein
MGNSAIVYPKRNPSYQLVIKADCSRDASTRRNLDFCALGLGTTGRPPSELGIVGSGNNGSIRSQSSAGNIIPLFKGTVRSIGNAHFLIGRQDYFRVGACVPCERSCCCDSLTLAVSSEYRTTDLLWGS